MPVRMVFATVAAANTTVSPYCTVTAPPACFAYFPVSKVNGFPLMVAWERVTGMWLLISGAYEKTQGFPWVSAYAGSLTVADRVARRLPGSAPGFCGAGRPPARVVV